MLQNLTCQKYKDGTYADALAAGCDAVQVKMDGWWTHVKWNHMDLDLFSKTCRHFETKVAPQAFKADLIAETMRGTQWSQHASRKGMVYVFDVWALVNEDVRPLSYRARMTRLAQLWKTFSIYPDPLKIVQTYPIKMYLSLWPRVEAGEFEGVVFRKLDEVGTPELIRQKNEVTAELKVLAVIEGEGKYAGMMGSLVCEDAEGHATTVGGGFSDAEREAIWISRMEYLNRWMTITAKARFDSGAYRHPNFKCWREDLE